MNIILSEIIALLKLEPGWVLSGAETAERGEQPLYFAWCDDIIKSASKFKVFNINCSDGILKLSINAPGTAEIPIEEWTIGDPKFNVQRVIKRIPKICLSLIN